MRAALCVLFAACVLADDSRGSKRPYVADAVGNTLPPPSSGPAPVGSPVNLLTPDRYEFYTFDESGELVKRLMTLQEIQAIVAAGEESEGLVTFANENQPTIAFNFSQPPHNKVHNVVTNVQNVLKAQMEAHKKNPQTNPTLDTPDVSDSWSLILPSIFGNTGVDIVPDKTSGSFSTPETETIEFDHINFDDNLSKEGNNPISSSTTVQKEDITLAATTKMPPTTEHIREVIPTAKTTPQAATTTTTPNPTTTTTKTKKPTTTSSTTTTTTTTTTTVKPTTTTSSTSKPTTTTTIKPRTTPTTKRPPTSTTPKPRTTASITTTTTKVISTAKPIVKVTAKPTTIRPHSTTRRQVSTTTQKTVETKIAAQTTTAANAATFSSTETSSPLYEKISTFIPISTAAYITERSTHKPVQTTKYITTLETTTKKIFVSTSKQPPTTMTEKLHPAITTYKPASSTTKPVTSTPKSEDPGKENATTITTQSVSPSTTVSSTEFMSAVSQPPKSETETPVTEDSNDIKINEPAIPLFDVAQSISQIASDLGSTNYQPIPTTSDLLQSTNSMDMDLESKESLELDIPTDSKNGSENKTNNILQKDDTDNFVKISTINPHPLSNENKPLPVIQNTSLKDSKPASETEIQGIVSTTSTGTPMDPILSESMDDLLSQVVNEAPQSIVNNENNFEGSNEISTTEKTPETSSTAIPAKIGTTSQSFSLETEHDSYSEIPISTKENNSLAESSEPEKSQDKKHEMNNIVKVSTSTDSSPVVSLTSENINKEFKPVKLENSTQALQTLSSDKQNNIIAVINAPKDEGSSSTPVAPQQQILHKTNTENNLIGSDKIENKDSDKITPTTPKVDEFKKKIQKVNIDYKEIAHERNNSWKLISTVSPPKVSEIPKDKFKVDHHNQEIPDKDIVLDVSKENQGLEVTTKDLGEDIAQFTELCNELAFRYWNAVVENIPNKRSFVLSPFSITSMLAMMFMGAKGATSGEMNEILKLDDMVTFNPHFTLKNISDSIETTAASGVAVSAFIRELYSDRNKGKILTFYKERAQHFYNGHVEEINFKLISDIIRRRTNLLVKRYTWGKIIEYMKSNTITMQPPLAAFSTNIFQTDCTGSSVEGRDGEMYFVVSPNVRQRRLVPVPAVLYKKGFLAGYDPVLDATAAALGNTNSIISTLFLMPGQQGNVVHAEDLEALEKRLLDSNPSTPAWNRLLRTLLPRIGLELQIPRFAHKSIFNISSTLKKMGLKDLFDADHADLGGLNGPSKDLYLSDMIQSTMFVTCGEGVIGEQHHIEEYPESIELTRRRRTSRWTSGWDEPRDYQRAFHDPHDVGEAMNLPLHLRPRQARLPARNAQPARLKFDRPFLYFVRHNPSGMILYVGRYNPRLLP